MWYKDQPLQSKLKSTSLRNHLHPSTAILKHYINHYQKLRFLLKLVIFSITITRSESFPLSKITYTPQPIGVSISEKETDILPSAPRKGQFARTVAVRGSDFYFYGNAYFLWRDLLGGLE